MTSAVQLSWRNHVVVRHAQLLLLLLFIGCSTDVSDNPTLRGGYQKDQSFRLRADAIIYRFDEVHHPAEKGLHLDAPLDWKVGDLDARAVWEKKSSARIVAIVPAGTHLRVTGIRQVSTPDTATIVPCATIRLDSTQYEDVSLCALSREIPGRNYPYAPTPNPDLLELMAKN